MAQPAPDLKIPSSATTVNVRIIDTTTRIVGIPLKGFVQPEIKGFTHLKCPAFSFLIEHPSNRKLLFDLGVRKDTENFAPRIRKRISDGGWDVVVKQGVREQLEANGVKGSDIEGVVWSHWHCKQHWVPVLVRPDHLQFYLMHSVLLHTLPKEEIRLPKPS
jgi:hypothetical protein